MGKMPGEIVDHRDGFYQIAWGPGYDSPFSGRTFWHQAIAFSLGLIEVVDEEPEEPPAPEAMQIKTPFDPFEGAFQLAFEF
jgi:hypothetical protein